MKGPSPFPAERPNGARTMIRSPRSMLFAGLFGLASAVPAVAQTGPGADAPPAPARLPAPASGVLSQADVLSALRKVSPDGVRLLRKGADGFEVYEMKLRRDDWNYTVVVNAPKAGG